MPTCIACQQPFQIRDIDREFYLKFDAPDPVMCPDCRLRQRLMFRNERTLYYRTSTLSNQRMISIYAPESPYVIYSPSEWWSDQWDGLSYGRDFDFNRPFFDQFRELQLQVPRIALFNVNPENSDFCQQAYNNRNCYMCSVVTKCEDCGFVTHSNNMQDCFDCTLTQNLQLSYDCIDSDKLYGCASCQSCQNSSGLMFCYDCIGCNDCFGSWGLRNKKFFIFNKPYQEAEYREKIATLGLSRHSSFVQLQQHFQTVAKQAVHRADRNINTLESVGNYLMNAQNSYICYDSFEIQDCAYSTWIFQSNNCYDVYGLGGGAWVYFGLGVEKLSNSAWCTFVSDGGNALYSDLSFYCMDIFGCVGVRNKKYCILNKQYSQAEYDELKAKIIAHMKQSGEWGQFFPANCSPFAYNETIAQDFFPLTKEQTLAAGLRWMEVDKKDYQLQTFQIPDGIQETQADISTQVLACETCGKNYKITPQEFTFHRNQSLPLSRQCPDCRYKGRRALRNPRQLYDRVCAKCSTPVQTTYAPDRPETIYCQKCYVETLN